MRSPLLRSGGRIEGLGDILNYQILDRSETLDLEIERRRSPNYGVHPITSVTGTVRQGATVLDLGAPSSVFHGQWRFTPALSTANGPVTVQITALTVDDTTATCVVV